MATEINSNLTRKEKELKHLKGLVAKSLLQNIGSVCPLIELVVHFEGLDISRKYPLINLSYLLVENCNCVNDVQHIASVLNLLTKYATNLLTPLQLRPQRWNVIDFHNPIYRDRVYPVKGTQVILFKLGYTMQRTESLAFPPSTEPNNVVVAEINVELMAGKMELELYLTGKHSCPGLLEKYLKFLTSIKEVRSSESQEITNNINLEETELKASLPVGGTGNNRVVDLPNIPLMVLDEIVSFTPSIEMSSPAVMCDICGSYVAEWTCPLCDNKNLCVECDKRWHQHPKRRTHNRMLYNATEEQSAAAGYAVGGGTIRTNAPNEKTSTTKDYNVVTTTNEDNKIKENNGARVDDVHSLLNLARHPPSIYKPPSLTKSRESEKNFVVERSSAVGRISNGQRRTEIALSNQIGKGTISNESAKKTEDFAFERPPLPASTLPRGIDKDVERKSYLIAAGSTKLYWMCNYCTYRNSSSSLLSEMKRVICEMCMKSTDNPIICKALENETEDEEISRNKSSVVDPLLSKENFKHLSVLQSQLFRSRFVDVQDEIYKKTTDTAERSRKEPRLRSLRSNQEKEEVVPFKLPSSSEHRLKINRDTSNSELSFNKLELPVRSLSIDRPQYTSKFVDTADEIYLEKKAAQEKFQQMQNLSSSSSSSSVAPLPQSQPVSKDHTQTTLPRFDGAIVTSVTRENSKIEASTRKETALLQGSEYQFSSQPSGSNDNYQRNVIDRLQLLRREKEAGLMYNQGTMAIRLIRDIEKEGFLDEEVECIFRLHGNSDPQVYYRDSWSAMIRNVLTKLKDQQIISKDSSPVELVRISLANCSGDVERAVAVFSQKWKESIDAVLKNCCMPDTSENRRYIVAVLDEANGDVNRTEETLVKELFKKKIWDETEEPSSDQVEAVSLDDDIYQRNAKHLNNHLAKILTDMSIPKERKIRMILSEADLPGWQRAENVLSILEEPTPLKSQATLSDIVDAVRNCNSIDECRQFLEQPCEICYDVYPSRLIKSLGCCQCKVCHECMKGHFEVVIRERFVRNLVCPVCSLPDIDTSEQTSTHFQFLILLLQNLISLDMYELFQMKLRDWHLMMDVSFRWCASHDCKFGFLINSEQAQNRVQCPSCKHWMCQHCKKPWEDQHDDVSCEEFQSWKENNNPEVQALGLARHLEENGIECPQCKCRYSLAKGGCMHFTCIQCRHEFCSGCLQPFRRGQKCMLLKSCAKAGLHCHHPRDCLFYLRDRDVTDLQKLLKDNNILYDTELSHTQVLAGLEGGQKCSVMEQKQTQSGFVDEVCGKQVPEDFAGLCEIHYKEYLVGLINKNNIDPATIMQQDELIILLKRVEKPVPKQKKGGGGYKETLLKFVQEQLPLPQRKRIQRVQRETYNHISTRSFAGVYQTDGFSEDLVETRHNNIMQMSKFPIVPPFNQYPLTDPV